MKFKSFLLAAAAMLFAVACGETPEGPVNPESQVAVMPMEVSYVGNGGENAVSVVAKGAWTATPSADWITVSPASGEAGTVSVKVTAAKNEVTEAREGVVIFTVGTDKAELKVKQAAGVAAGSALWTLTGNDAFAGAAGVPAWNPGEGVVAAWDGAYYAAKGLTLPAKAEFKFTNGSWDVNRGYNGSKSIVANYYYAAEANGGNITVAADGTYDIYLNEEASVFYVMEAGKLPAEAQDSETMADAEVDPADAGWRVVGGHTGWNEKEGDDMTLANGYWGITNVVLTAEANEFKFVQNKKWNGAVGYTGELLNAGYYYTANTEGGAGNIKVAAGTYDLYLNEEATVFYILNAGQTPAEAQNGEAVPAAEASIEVGEVGETSIFFNVTTSANVTAAAWYVTPTDYVDEELTAEYILEGGFELYEDELGTTVELAYRRASSGTEYTIFLAYETANGVDMVTATATTTGNANIAFVAESVDVFVDDLYDESIVTFSGEEYEVVVWLASANIVDKDFYFEESNNIITKAVVKDAATGDKIDDIEAGEFSVYYAGVDNIYYAGAYFIATSGIQVVAEYEGPIANLGGGAPVGGDIYFTVASATITPHEDYASDPSVWYLELTSTTGDMIGLTIDTDVDEAPFLFSGMYGLVPNSGAGIYMYDSWAEINGQMGMFIMPSEEEGLAIQTTYDGVTPESDQNFFQGVLTAYSPVNGQPIGTIYIQSGILSCYGNNGGGEEGGETEGPVATMDYWGGANFVVYIPNGDTIVALDCYAGTQGSFAAGLPTGTYTVTEDHTNYNMTIHAGYEMYPGYPYGAHITDSIGVNVLGYINQGTLEVVNNGDGTYKFTFSVCDDNWIDYAGTYEGAVEATDYISMYGVAPKKAARVAMK